MKDTTLPSLRVDSKPRAAAESVLRQDETLSSFLIEAVRLNIERREAQREFMKRGLAAGDAARKSGRYVSSEEILERFIVLGIGASCFSQRHAESLHPDGDQQPPQPRPPRPGQATERHGQMGLWQKVLDDGHHVPHGQAA